MTHTLKTVTLVEVSPRDGLQDAPWIDTKIKLQLIEKLVQSGLRRIEVTSFVSPKWVPVLKDHAKVMQALRDKTDAQYSALIPNETGLQAAIDCNCQHIAVITAVSETFAHKNMNCTITESLSRIEKIIAIAKPKNIFVRAYISCVLGCPYEGFITPEKTAALAKRLILMGCDEIALGDTIGAGTPKTTNALIQAVTALVPINKIALHFHDANGQALENIKAGLQLGISVIDCSVGGLGGCPYAKGARGNIATEDVIHLLNTLGIETGVNLEKVIAASEFIKTQLNYF